MADPGQTLLYADEGAGPFVTGCFEAALVNLAVPVRRIDAAGLLAGEWRGKATTLILPGGADRPYLRKLGEPGAAMLRDWVGRGGRFFGSCAGGYYAARRIRFDSPDLRVREDRPLGFFAGTAVGPLPGLAPPFRDHPSCAVAASVDDDHGERVPCLYWGGFRLEPDADAEFDPLARYAELPAGANLAAARVRVGEGVAVLCGFHPEVGGDDLARLDGCDPATVERLGAGDAGRRRLFRRLWESLTRP